MQNEIIMAEEITKPKRKRKPGGGRKKSFTEPYKMIGTNVPLSKVIEFRAVTKELIRQWLNEKKTA